MFKILIVEDEQIIRKGIVTAFDWGEFGFVIVGEAMNGEEGLEKILELKPDAVITDIKMPKKNGITMIELAQKSHDFECIILTSHAEFDFAKRAIAQQVFEYLLKPIDEVKLENIMKKLQEKLLDKQKIKLIMDNQSVGINLDYFRQLAATQNEYVEQMIEEIRNRYAQPLSLELLSEELGVSSSYLSRKFKMITGRTFLDFLNQYRISKAVKLLKKGSYKNYEISELTGFTDYKHFSIVFKKYMSVSPTNYIKR